MILNLVFFITGLFLLYFCAGWLVSGSSGLAKSLGLTPIIIGLTVVAFGTSAPEMMVSLVSSFKGKSMIAVGNVIGSNICNIALVLGFTAIIRPFSCQSQVVKRDLPLMLLASFFLLLISLNSTISRFEGAVLFSGVIGYTCFNYFTVPKKIRAASASASFSEAPLKKQSPLLSARSRQILLIIAGIAGVIIGAEILIDSAVKIMRVFGVSDKFIGLTVVALGTSLPELATSLVAAIKNEMDISLGNLLGSNVFNILSVLGAAAIARPIIIPGGFIQSGLMIDYLAMMFISLLPWLMLRRDKVLSRCNGFLLLFCYFLYLFYLIKIS